MTAPKSHACDSCGGQGGLSPFTEGFYCPDTACPVCLGAGRISDVMPVSDSIADAETLRLMAWAAPRAHVSNALRRARSFGLRVAGEIEHGGGWLLPNVTAADAARAAFRAVPGLRA